MTLFKRFPTSGLWLLCMFSLSLHSTWAIAESTATGNDPAGKAIYKHLLPKGEAGDPEAQTTLGLMRLRGDAVERDLKIARAWLGRAALQNHTPAQYYLGQLLLLDVFKANPHELEQQLSEGLGWLRRASRDQHPQSQLLYAQTLLESQREHPFGHSKIEAQQHLDSCAETFLPCTSYALERLDNKQAEVYCPKNELCERKRRLLYTLANAENADARYRLSKFEGEDRLFWLRRAARMAHPEASLELAELVLASKAPLQPEDPAVLAMLNNSAQQGNIQAMFLLGSMLIEGKRFPVNKALGIEWLKLAANNGNEAARAQLDQIQPPTQTGQHTGGLEFAQPTESKP